jgi:hypothetical protein
MIDRRGEKKRKLVASFSPASPFTHGQKCIPIISIYSCGNMAPIIEVRGEIRKGALLILYNY